MRYKVGDKVLVTESLTTPAFGKHDVPIGEVVEIVEVDSRDVKDGRDYKASWRNDKGEWWLGSDEFRKATKAEIALWRLRR